MDLQALVDGMSQQWQRERADSQLTLGKLMLALEALPPDTPIDLHGAHSYRGYYCDLAFKSGGDPMRAADLLSECKAAMGRAFTGYKGGDFVMGERTPVWVAQYGSTGDRLMALGPDGRIETAPDED